MAGVSKSAKFVPFPLSDVAPKWLLVVDDGVMICSFKEEEDEDAERHATAGGGPFPEAFLTLIIREANKVCFRLNISADY